MPDMQLDIFGGETDHHVVAKRRQPMGRAQFMILDYLRKHRTITVKTAGKIIHLNRDKPCHGCADDNCEWVLKDGNKTLRALKDRGHVMHAAKDTWVLHAAN